MSKELKLWVRGEFDEASIGQRLHDAPVSVTAADEERHDVRYLVANGSTQVLWDAASDLAEWDALIVVSDQDGQLEILIDDAGDNGEAFIVLDMRANLPFVLPKRSGLAGDGSAGSFDGTADSIEKLTWKNNSGAAAGVRCFAVD